MELLYSSNKLKEQCTSIKAARKLFDGNVALATSLLARINALQSASIIRDIIVQRSFRFHDLENKHGRNLDGFFAIDVKTRKEPWRIILQPLDENKKPFDPCHIDEISAYVKIVKITEVSNHYG